VLPVETLGLTAAEVAERVAAGEVNRVDDSSSRSLGEIVRSNVVTRFNALITALAVVVLVVGSPRDALFAVVMVCNAVIGIAQELRSKRTLDALSVVAAPRLTVLRDGRHTDVGRHEVVRDDVVVLAPGDQLVVDGTVLDSDGLTIDESLLTGEADPVPKGAGDGALSGSFVVAGSGLLRATAVGEEAYAARLTKEAKAFRRPRTELERGIDLILRSVTWLIVPVGVGLFLAQRYGEGDALEDALIGTVAGLVALVPQGLVLLLSMTQAVAVIRLGRARVLVQQLQAVETLARVTLLATDKTGTLTTGAVVLEHVDVLDDAAPVEEVLAALVAADPHPDATVAAIGAVHATAPGWTLHERIPFSSAYKYSAADFGDHGTWYLGAPDVLLADGSDALARAQARAAEGMRVLAVGRAGTLAPAGELPADLQPVALVVCADEIRPDAADTIAYFGAEHVVTKVISGDNPRTVAAIATRCGVPDADRWIDARTLSDDPDALAEQAAPVAVFGRVTPDVKRALVHAAQRQGEVVAMTGDGVNDTLALKDADLGIAMGAGTPAAKSVAELVLLDNRFATLPGVVAEGRRVIANIERVARLFVTKTIWAATLALIIGVVTTSYPFVPRQLTVVDALTIGIPGFVLSFQHSHEPARPGFLRRVGRFSVPIGIVIGITAMAVFGVLRSGAVGADRAEAQNATTIVLIVLGLVALHELMRPLDALRGGLLAVLVALGVAAFTIPFVADFFSLQLPAADHAAVIGVGLAAGGVAIVAAARNEDRIAAFALRVRDRARRRSGRARAG
jgi:cation-transporting ATPase E